MKNVLFMMATIFLTISANAQANKQEEVSKSETVQLLQKDGVLLRKDFYDIGKIEDVTFQNIVITDISTGEKTGALRIETHFYSSSLGVETYIGTLDFDELEGCIKSLTYIKDNVITSLPETYTECEYKTKDGVSLGAFVRTTKKARDWRIYIQTRSYSDRSQEFLDSDKLIEVISLLNKSLENLRIHL